VVWLASSAVADDDIHVASTPAITIKPPPQRRTNACRIILATSDLIFYDDSPHQMMD